jgi:hypothetical protein
MCPTRKKHPPKSPANSAPDQNADALVPAGQKPVRRPKVSPKDKEDTTTLLADVDASHLEAAARQVHADAQRIKAMSSVKTELVYPEIVPEGVARQIKPSRQGKAKKPAAQKLPLASSHLLDQLRSQVKNLQDQQDREQQQLAIIENELGQTLYQVFSYLHDLSQQLNVIKPVIPRSYLITEDYEFKNLAWQQGFVDYRTLPQSSGNTVGAVSFNYHLIGKEPLTIEREGGVADAFRQRLFDSNLSVKVKEFRLENYFLERARFTIAPEIRVSIRWEMDPHNGLLVIQANNLERLGFNRYILPSEKVTPALLDELGRTVLGESYQFSSLMYR